jgi:hypothetical protein
LLDIGVGGDDDDNDNDDYSDRDNSYDDNHHLSAFEFSSLSSVFQVQILQTVANKCWLFIEFIPSLQQRQWSQSWG